MRSAVTTPPFASDAPALVTHFHPVPTPSGRRTGRSTGAQFADLEVSVPSKDRVTTSEDNMMLKNKTAVIYGAGGAIGSAVAQAFAREGARVFLTGRTVGPLEGVADEIERDGGAAQVAQVNALDESGIEGHLDRVVAAAGGVGLSVNAVGFDEVQGVPLVDLSLEDFAFPIASWSQTVFLTSRAAARRMTTAGSGVILTVIPAAAGTGLASGFGAACAAVDS